LAKVLVSVKLFPSEPDINMTQLKDKVTKSLEGRASIYKFEEEPIAFGLVALIAHVMLPEDAGGQMQDVEDRLRNVEGINEVQVLVSRRV
jgi:elongation factor 1-beta